MSSSLIVSVWSPIALNKLSLLLPTPIPLGQCPLDNPEDIAIPETDVVIDLPAPKPQDRTEMNIDRNIATAKKASRSWDKDKV